MNRLNKRKIAVGRIAITIIGTSISGVLTYYFYPLMDNSGDTVSLIASIFSILAGVLIAIISILGDPSMLMDQSWRHNYLAAEEIQRRLHRKTDTFVLYVILLMACFVFYITPKDSEPFKYVQMATFFLTALSFFASITMPYDLIAVQKDRMRKAVNSQKSRQQGRDV